MVEKTAKKEETKYILRRIKKVDKKDHPLSKMENIFVRKIEAPFLEYWPNFYKELVDRKIIDSSPKYKNVLEKCLIVKQDVVKNPSFFKVPILKLKGYLPLEKFEGKLDYEENLEDINPNLLKPFTQPPGILYGDILLFEPSSELKEYIEGKYGPGVYDVVRTSEQEGEFVSYTPKFTV